MKKAGWHCEYTAPSRAAERRPFDPAKLEAIALKVCSDYGPALTMGAVRAAVRRCDPTFERSRCELQVEFVKSLRAVQSPDSGWLLAVGEAVAGLMGGREGDLLSVLAGLQDGSFADQQQEIADSMCSGFTTGDGF